MYFFLFGLPLVFAEPTTNTAKKKLHVVVVVVVVDDDDCNKRYECLEREKKKSTSHTMTVEEMFSNLNLEFCFFF